MGRAIDQGNKLDDHERRLKLVEDALEGIVQTRVHHVDLTDDLNIEDHGVVLEPDEEFTPPAGKRKKTKTTKSRKVESML